MGTNSPAVLFASAWLAITLAPPAPAQEPLTRTGPHFVVQLHPGTWPASIAERIAGESLAAVEGAWPTIDSLLSLHDAKPSTLHVYADDAPFRELEKQAGVVFPGDSLAKLDTAEAHVLVMPRLSQQALQVIGLPETTRRQLIVRAAQLAAVQMSPITIDDPWLAEVFGYGVLEAITNPKQQFGVDPAYDTRRYDIYRDHVEGRVRVLKGTILDFEAPKSRADLDAAEARKCVLARVMAASNKNWAKKLFGKPPKKVTARASIRFAAVEGALGNNWLKTESLFTSLHQSIEPRWQLTAPMAALVGGRLLCVGEAQASAQFQAMQPPPAGAYTIRGKFQVVPCGDDVFRVQLDWAGKDMIGIFLGVGKWSVQKWETGGLWQTIVEGKAPIYRDHPFEAAVEVGKNLRLLVDGAEIATWDYGARTMHGRWSFGVNDCVVWVDNLRCEAGAVSTK